VKFATAIAATRLLRRYWLALMGIVLLLAGGFLLTTEHPAIWPLRNITLYRVTEWWQERQGTPQPADTGALYGCVRRSTGEPQPDSLVLVSEPDGTTHEVQTDAEGCYRLDAVPAGRYVPVVGGYGLPDTAVRPWNMPIRIAPDGEQRVDVTLPPVSLPDVAPGADLRLGAPETVSWPLPEPGEAVRREIVFDSGGQPNQPAWLYLPTDATGYIPTLLTIYPGPADSWEGVSIPLAAAGYAVIATGPAYSFDLDNEVAELERLVAFARAGTLPHVDGRRIAILGGSYSSMHAMRMVQRDTGFRGVVLLGPPSDLFAMRRRFEAGEIFPPFGLDQALIALGWPNTAPERYWRYSARFHVRADMPPMLLMHSRDDDVVPFTQAELLADALEQVGAEYEAHFFDGQSHYLLADRPSEQLDMLYSITLDFLAQVMGGEELRMES
jgi:dipeptidyl aminopeptidase/acylaminoacyl peptidase